MKETAERSAKTSTGSQRDASMRVVVQPKLAVNQPGDPYEQEADAMAEQVVHSTAEHSFMPPLPLGNTATVQPNSTMVMRQNGNTQTAKVVPEEDEIEKAKKSFEAMMKSNLAGGNALGDVEGILKEPGAHGYDQMSTTKSGVGKLLYPEFKKLLQGLDQLTFDESDLSAAEKSFLVEYQTLLQPSNNTPENQKKKVELEKKPQSQHAVALFKTFIQAKEQLKTSLQTSLEKARKGALDKLIKDKQEEAEKAKLKYVPTEAETEALKKQIENDPNIQSAALDEAAKTVSEKSAAPLCFFISRYLYFRSVERINSDTSFAQWYVLEIRRGHVGKTSSGGLAWGAFSPGSKSEQSGMVSARDKEVPVKRITLDSSGTRVAIIRMNGHFILIVKDEKGDWHNLDHVEYGDKEKRFKQHGGYTDWSKVDQLHYNPDIKPKKATTSKPVQGGIQRKLAVNQPGDRYEQEADQIADQVMWMKSGDMPLVQRMPLSPVLSPLQRKESSEGDSGGTFAPPIVSEVLSAGGGRQMDANTSEFMESRFRQDFSQVRVHTDTRAAESAHAIQARAYTSGKDVVFGAGEYQPENETGKRLLAHELAHVGQQTGGNVQTKIQRKAAGFTNTRAIIPIAKFIEYVKAVEKAYGGEDLTSTLTRLRMMYYGDLAFRVLIPAAHDLEAAPLSFTSVIRSNFMRDKKIYPGEMDEVAYKSLTAQANENSTDDPATLGDNPSPYIKLDNGEEIDVGHLFLGMDALIHPITIAPFTTFDVPNIDPSTHVADLGIAVVWMAYHEFFGKPHEKAPPKAAKLTKPTLEDYYQMSAPEQDLLGDVDAFAMTKSMISNPINPDSKNKLSEIIQYYYQGQKDNKFSVDHRWSNFISMLGWKYTDTNGVVTLDKSVRTGLLQKVNNFCDLYYSGDVGAAAQVLNGRLVEYKWNKYAEPVIDKFLVYVRDNLQKELNKKLSDPVGTTETKKK